MPSRTLTRAHTCTGTHPPANTLTQEQIHFHTEKPSRKLMETQMNTHLHTHSCVDTSRHTPTHLHTRRHACALLLPRVHTRSWLHARRTLTLTGGALGRQRVPGGALAPVAPLRVEAGASPAQQRVPRTLIHVCARGRESGCEDTDQGGVAHGSFSLRSPAHHWLRPGEPGGSGLTGCELGGAGTGQPSQEPGSSGEAHVPRGPEGGPEKNPAGPCGRARCKHPQGRLSHPPPPTPASCTSFHSSGPPQGLCTCCSPFRLLLQPLFTTFAPTLSHNCKPHSQPQPQAPQNRTRPWGPHSPPARGPLKSSSQQPFCISPGLNFINISLPIRS